MWRFILGLGAGIGGMFLLNQKNKTRWFIGMYYREPKSWGKEFISEEFSDYESAEFRFRELKKKRNVTGDYFYKFENSYISTGLASREEEISAKEISKMKKDAKKEKWKLAIATLSMEQGEDIVTLQEEDYKVVV